MVQDALHALELKIGVLLRKGVLTAGAILVAGWIMMVFAGNHTLAEYKTYNERGLWEELNWILLTKDYGSFVTYAGLVVLISLPLLRVALMGYLFFRQKDRPMAIIAFGVLFVLCLSFLLGVEL